jgi:hypothetical protein
MLLLPLLAGLVALVSAGSGTPFASSKGGEVPSAAQKEKRPASFLIFGTVFTPQGFALPGAEIRVRKAGEKKVRGEAVSDRRGEFAIRVPPGTEYEVTVTARGFAAQAQKVSAAGASREDLVFRMAPQTQDGAGGKKP